MKHTFLAAAALAVTTLAAAQRSFDSTAYTRFYINRWENMQYGAFPKETALTTEDKIAGLSKCWAEARYNFANFDLVPHLNWDSVYTAYIPKVVATGSNAEYYNVLRNFYQHLRDGHTAISLPRSHYADMNGTLPIELRWVEGKVIVTHNTSVRKEDAAIRPGMEVVSFASVPILEYIQKNISPVLNFSTVQDSTERIYRQYLPIGKAGSEVSMVFRDPSGKQLAKTLKRVPVENYLQPYPLIDFKILKGNIAYLQINSFNDGKVVHLFDSLFASIAPTTALIIDIRNNGGGNGNNGFEVLGCLTDKPFYPGKTVLRKYMPLARTWNSAESTEIGGFDWKPYKGKLYSKPVVLLTSGYTYSAAEDFTATFKTMNRGKVIGAPTGGSTGQPMFFSIPGGGVGYVCAKRDLFSNGEEFVGVGIQPDIPVVPTVKGIREGKDEILDAALQYLHTLK